MYKLLTHTDLDGVSCAVLAKLAWGENVDIMFCRNPADVTNTFMVNLNRGCVEVRTARDDIDLGQMMQMLYTAAGDVRDIAEGVNKRCLGKFGRVTAIGLVKS